MEFSAHEHTNFPNIKQAPQNSRHQINDMKQGPYPGTTNNSSQNMWSPRRPGTQGLCAPVLAHSYKKVLWMYVKNWIYTGMYTLGLTINILFSQSKRGS